MRIVFDDNDNDIIEKLAKHFDDDMITATIDYIDRKLTHYQFKVHETQTTHDIDYIEIK